MHIIFNFNIIQTVKSSDRFTFPKIKLKTHFTRQKITTITINSSLVAVLQNAVKFDVKIIARQFVKWQLLGVELTIDFW